LNEKTGDEGKDQSKNTARKDKVTHKRYCPERFAAWLTFMGRNTHAKSEWAGPQKTRYVIHVNKTPLSLLKPV